ncbi:MAG TPA: MFS transporter [Jiangellales bacterium]|nr:MFS transporter [Jiangellales bacterium]
MTQGPPPTPPSGQRRGARAARATYEHSTRAARATYTRVRKATHAGGAGESGLARLIEMHAVNAAGDALIAVSLAGTLFFSVPTGEARSQVALYLVLTMAPFAVVAPLVGPFLDRFRHGRRWAIGVSTAARGFLCWVMAGAVSGGGDISLYAAAFGCLVASRAYGVSRAAAVPRVLPAGTTLVSANSRISLAGVAGATLAAPIGVGVAAIGADWALRLAFLVFVAATVQAIRLPPRIDSSVGEEPASMEEGPPGDVGAPGNGTGDGTEAADGAAGVRTTRPLPIGRRRGRRRAGYRVGSAVVRALRANVSLRGFTGFLTIYLAFVLREVPVAGLSPEVGIALAAAAAMLGGTAGSGVGSRLRAARPDRIVLALVVVAVVAAALAALLWGLATMLLVALLAGFTQQLGRLSLDAVVQRDVPERVRTSTFARSETSLQLAWVIGGALALALPLDPLVGFGVAGALTLVGLLAAVRVRLDYPAGERPDTPAA